MCNKVAAIASTVSATSLHGWSKPLRIAAFFSVCVCATSTASAQWTITDLSGLPGGRDYSYASGINNAGQVVGVSGAATGDRAFLWQNGVMTNLGDLPGGGDYSGGDDYSFAYSINNAGQVVGVSNAATGPRAFLWQNGVMTNLGDLPGGNDYSEARSINNAGQVVGVSGAATGNRAFLWQNGVMTNLGDLPWGGDNSYAFGINNAGQVVGGGVAGSYAAPGAYDAGGATRAFLWQNGVMTELGNLRESYLSYARGINDAGQVVGFSYGAGGNSAFLWQNGVSTELGNLTGGGYPSVALGINNAGQVVGVSGAATGNRAFLWQDGVMTDLSAVSGVAGTGWSLTEATAINDFGQIVGSGTNPQGVTSAFILTPVPEPEVYLMMGVGVCLAGVIARRRKNISQ